MDLNFQGAQEVDESRKRSATMSRIKLLGFFLGLIVVARIFIKDPAKPKIAVHEGKTARALPGLVNAIPQAAKDKMDAQALARLQADEKQNLARFYSKGKGTTEALASVPAAPAAAVQQVAAAVPAEPVQTEESIRKLLQTPRYKPPTVVKEEKPRVLVVFRGGGHFEANDVETEGNRIRLDVDHSMSAGLPRDLVSRVQRNAAKWTEPIPQGFVKLKPAKGITVILAERIASRISIGAD